MKDQAVRDKGYGGGVLFSLDPTPTDRSRLRPRTPYPLPLPLSPPTPTPTPTPIHRVVSFFFGVFGTQRQKWTDYSCVCKLYFCVCKSTCLGPPGLLANKSLLVLSLSSGSLVLSCDVCLVTSCLLIFNQKSYDVL
jgi:hypothetical protein